MPVRMTREGRAETREDKRTEKDKKKKPKGSSKLDIFKSYGKYDGKPVELKKGGISKIDKLRAGKGQFTIEGRMQTLKDKLKKKFGKKTGGLTGGQVKLDKNKDGKISGEDFKMMKRKRGGATRKNPNSPKGQNPISEYDKKGKLKYTAANQGGMMAKSTRGYGAARTSGMGLQDEQVKPGKVQKAFLGIMAMKKAKKKGAKGAEFLSPALLAKRILGKKTGGPISGPKGGLPRMSDIDKDKIGKLKQQLNRFRNTPTKGGGADESKRMSDKTKQSIKNLVKRIGRLTPGGRMGSDAGKILREKLKKKIMTPAKKMGGGMINRFNKGSIARVPGGYSKEGSGRISDKALKGNSPQKLFSEKEKMGNKKTSGMRKKMGGGMMMKQYNKGGSVTASCKLGRNKATKLY